MAEHDMSKMSDPKATTVGTEKPSEPPKHDMSNMDGSKAGADDTMDMSEPSKHDMSKMSDPKATTVGTEKPSEPPKHDMSNMASATANAAGAMDMPNMAGSEPADDEARTKKLQLEQMRQLQAKLAQAYEHEVSTQRKHDAEASELMERDPHAHVVMMKIEQEHRQLALELPRILLQREGALYQELVHEQEMTGANMPDTGAMMGKMVTMSRWSQVPLLALGAWLLVSPFMLSYRSVPLTWSDLISGILVITLAVIAFHTGRIWAAVANMVVGLWIAFAPLAFWAPEAASYANGTMVGALVIVFAFIVPMLMPMPGSEVPSGWQYNPSSWRQRAPILVLAFLR